MEIKEIYNVNGYPYVEALNLHTRLANILIKYRISMDDEINVDELTKEGVEAIKEIQKDLNDNNDALLERYFYNEEQYNLINGKEKLSEEDKDKLKEFDDDNKIIRTGMKINSDDRKLIIKIKIKSNEKRVK